MKNFCCSLVFLFFVSVSFAQTSNVSIDSILNNATEITSASDYNFMYEDAMTYFDLNNDYSTPLQKANFMKSAEYKTYSDSLNKLNAAFKKSTCYVSFNGKNENGKVQYDLKAKGFYFYTGYNYYPNLKGLPNCYQNGSESGVLIKFSNLLTSVRNNTLSDYDKLTGEKPSPMCHIFVPISPESAEKIEASNNYPEVYILFQPVSVIKNKEVNVYYKLGVGEAYETVNYLNVLVKKIVVTIDGEVVYNKSL